MGNLSESISLSSRKRHHLLLVAPVSGFLSIFHHSTRLNRKFSGQQFHHRGLQKLINFMCFAPAAGKKGIYRCGRTSSGLFSWVEVAKREVAIIKSVRMTELQRD
jgi:hypothetical protein